MARTGLHGRGAGAEVFVDHGFGIVSQRLLTQRERAETFDSGAADDVALVLGEKGHDARGSNTLRPGVGDARYNQAEVPAGPRLGGRKCLQQAGQFVEEGCERIAVTLGYAAGHIGGTLADLDIVAEEFQHQRPDLRLACGDGRGDGTRRIQPPPGLAKLPLQWLHNGPHDG